MRTRETLWRNTAITHLVKNEIRIVRGMAYSLFKAAVKNNAICLQLINFSTLNKVQNMDQIKMNFKFHAASSQRGAAFGYSLSK